MWPFPVAFRSRHIPFVIDSFVSCADANRAAFLLFLLFLLSSFSSIPGTPDSSISMECATLSCSKRKAVLVVAFTPASSEMVSFMAITVVALHNELIWRWANCATHAHIHAQFTLIPTVTCSSLRRSRARGTVGARPRGQPVVRAGRRTQLVVRSET